MCVCVCVCVLFTLCVRVCVSRLLSVGCVGVGVGGRGVLIVRVCACVCVWVRGGGGAKEDRGEKCTLSIETDPNNPPKRHVYPSPSALANHLQPSLPSSSAAAGLLTPSEFKVMVALQSDGSRGPRTSGGGAVLRLT